MSCDVSTIVLDTRHPTNIMSARTTCSDSLAYLCLYDNLLDVETGRFDFPYPVYCKLLWYLEINYCSH